MPSHRRLFVGLYALSGAAALVYEITWTRLLTLQMGQTVAAISTVLAAFMGGLAAGSWIGGRLTAGARARSHAGRRPAAAYAALEIARCARRARAAGAAGGIRPGAGVGVRRGAGARTLRDRARPPLCRAPWHSGGRHGRDVSDRGGVVGGERRHVAIRPADGAGTSAAAVGALYAANTAGAAAGALAAGFWLLPAIGLRGTT